MCPAYFLPYFLFWIEYVVITDLEYVCLIYPGFAARFALPAYFKQSEGFKPVAYSVTSSKYVDKDVVVTYCCYIVYVFVDQLF